MAEYPGIQSAKGKVKVKSSSYTLRLSRQDVLKSDIGGSGLSYSARVRLVRQYGYKYGMFLDENGKLKPRTLSERLSTHRNISNRLKEGAVNLLSALETFCPYKTGFGKLYGIRFYQGAAEVIIGGNVAEYIVHLGYPEDPRLAGNKWTGWIDRGLAMARSNAPEGIRYRRVLLDYGIVKIKIYV